MEPIVRAELDRCRPWIEAALARQELFSFGEIEDALEENRAQLWPGARSCFVTRIEDYAEKRVIQTWLAGGDMAELVATQRPVIEQQARDWGCTHAMIEGGRDGWRRVLQPHGYAFAGVVLMKDLRQ